MTTQLLSFDTSAAHQSAGGKLMIDEKKIIKAIDKVLYTKHHYYDIKPLLKELNTELKKELGLI